MILSVIEETIERLPKTVIVEPPIRKMAFDVALNMTFGYLPDDKDDICDLFDALTAGLYSYPINLPMFRYGRALKSRELLLKRLNEEITRQRFKSLHTNSLLSILLQAKNEDGTGLSNESIADDLINMLFAGHDTTVAVLTNTIFLLGGKHKKWQDELYAELATINVKDEKQLQEAKLTEAVIKETLRLYPPAPVIYRRMLEDTEYEGKVLKKGLKLLTSSRSHKKKGNGPMQASIIQIVG